MNLDNIAQIRIGGLKGREQMFGAHVEAFNEKAKHCDTSHFDIPTDSDSFRVYYNKPKILKDAKNQPCMIFAHGGGCALFDAIDFQY